MQKSVWEYCSLNPDLAVDVEEFQIKLNNRWSNKANQDKNSLEQASASSSTLHDKRHSMAHMQELLEACDHSCRDSLESLDQLLTTIHGIKTSYYDVTSRTNSLMSKCESLLEEQHTLQHTVEVLTKTLKPFKDIEDIAQILGIPYESIHNNHNNGHNSPPPSHTTPATPSSSSTSSSTLTQHLDPRSPEFKELLIKLSSAVIFLQNHPDIMENQKYTMWLEKLQVRAISLIGRAMRELIDKTAKQCRDIIQQRLFSSSHHPAITNGSGGGGGGHSGGGVTSRLFSEDQPVESLPIYQKFRGLSFRMKELVGVLLRGYLASVTVNDDGSASINNSSDAPPSITTTDQSPRLRTPSNAIASLGVSSSSALGKYFLHLARHDYAILAEVKKSYALIRMELLQPFLNEAFLHSLANATSSSSTSIVPVSANSSGTNFSSLIEEKRFSDAKTGSGKRGSAEGVSQQHYLSLSTVIRQSFSTLLRIVQLEFQLFDSLFNIDHVHHVTPVSTLTRSMSLESSSDMVGISISNAPTPRTTNNKGVTSSTAVTKTKKGGVGSGSGHQDDPASVFASDLSRVIEYISNVTRDFLRPLIIRESSVDELCRVISILSEDIKSQIAILQIPSILVKQLTTGLENVMNDSKERVIYCAETKLRQQIQFYEPLPSHLSYPEILETYEKRGEKRTDSAVTTTSFPSSTLSIEDVYDTWYPPMRLTLSLLSKLYGIIDNLIFEDFARRSIEIVITILHQGSETIKRQQKTLMMHGDLFLVRHLLILREQLIPFEVKLQSSEKFLDFTNTRLAIQQIITTTSSSSTQSTTTTTTGGGNNNNSNALTSVGGATSSFLRFDENNLLLQFAKSGIPMMKETHQDMKKELDNSLKKACVSLKITACKFLLGPLDGLLAKVVAFIGDIPYHTNTANTATPSEGNGGSNKQRGGSLLSQEHTNLLKNQSFLRFERMKECFDQVQHLLLQRIPDLKAMMKLYVDNPTTRSVLMKSIIQEFEVSKLRTDTIILSCVESGQQKELETSLTVIYRKIVNEFSTV